MSSSFVSIAEQDQLCIDGNQLDCVGDCSSDKRSEHELVRLSNIMGISKFQMLPRTGNWINYHHKSGNRREPLLRVDHSLIVNVLKDLRTVIDLPQRWKCRGRSLPARKVHHRTVKARAAASRTAMLIFSSGYFCSDQDEHLQDVWYSDHSETGIE